MKTYTLLIVSVLLALAYFNLNLNNHNLQLVSEFAQWKQTYHKTYESEQEQIYRLTVFVQNLKNIKNHNSQLLKSYQLGINIFSDLTQQQFAARHLTLITPNKQLRVQQIKSFKADDREINWVDKGYVTSIKDQGQCGACWAFAAIGPLEAQIKMKGGPLVSLSAQQLMDCSNKYGNYGCNGGFMTNSYQYIKDKGITTDQKYPYKGVNQKCVIDGGQYKVNGYTQMQDCQSIANQLMNLPVAVAVDASKFYQYKSGVFSCTDKPLLNHAFALVGMTKDYWLGKQQWGVKWGQNGYIKIAKTGTACGLCTMASYPN